MSSLLTSEHFIFGNSRTNLQLWFGDEHGHHLLVMKRFVTFQAWGIWSHFSALSETICYNCCRNLFDLWLLTSYCVRAVGYIQGQGRSCSRSKSSQKARLLWRSRTRPSSRGIILDLVNIGLWCSSCRKNIKEEFLFLVLVYNGDVTLLTTEIHLSFHLRLNNFLN